MIYRQVVNLWFLAKEGVRGAAFRSAVHLLSDDFVFLLQGKLLRVLYLLGLVRQNFGLLCSCGNLGVGSVIGLCINRGLGLAF